MALNGRSISCTALDHIRVNRALYQYIDFPQFFGFVLEYPDEFFADDLPLFLWFCNSSQLLQKAVFCVDPDQVHIKSVPEGLFHEVALVFSQQAVIYKHTGQIPANSLMQQHRCHRGIHSAGQCQQNLFTGKLFPVFFDGLLYKIFHLPLPLAAADTEEEVIKYLLSKLRMGYLRVELYRIEFSAFVRHCCTGTFAGTGDYTEALRHLADVIRMTHPADAVIGKPTEKDAVVGKGLRFAVLTGRLRTADNAAGHICHQLRAIADTKNRNPQI